MLYGAIGPPPDSNDNPVVISAGVIPPGTDGVKTSGEGGIDRYSEGIGIPPSTNVGGVLSSGCRAATDAWYWRVIPVFIVVCDGMLK